MINNKKSQLIILIILFLIPSYFAISKSDPVVVKKNAVLSDALAHIDGYRIVDQSPLEKKVYNFLDLDDYAFITYEKNHKRITLYIGFYYTADKVSSAHSPLVCFPGQGWTISKPVYTSKMVGNNLIHYAQIDATLGNDKELITYWYQSGDDTTPWVFRNKFNTFYNKIFKDDQQHAFIRISTSFSHTPHEQADQEVANFLTAFFPYFIDFIGQ